MADATGHVGKTSPREERIDRTSERVLGQVLDALDLAQYAVESGATTADGAPLPADVSATIQATAAKLGAFSTMFEGPPSITTKEWNDFELAYYRLATFMSPVTAETLRNTEGTSRSGRFTLGTGGGGVTWTNRLCAIIRGTGQYLFGFSPAQRFARGLWLVAIFFALFVVWADWYLFTLGQEADADTAVQAKRRLVDFLIPWAYGGLGSCAYLLRSAHTFIYGRSFDLRRKPEYFNRILLGAISGGATILFMKYLVDQEGAAIQLSSAALGFIGGYSTDFLFNTIERIVAAVFPRVAVETVAAASPKPRLLDASARSGPEAGPAERRRGSSAPTTDDRAHDA